MSAQIPTLQTPSLTPPAGAAPPTCAFEGASNCWERKRTDPSNSCAANWAQNTPTCWYGVAVKEVNYIGGCRTPFGLFSYDPLMVEMRAAKKRNVAILMLGGLAVRSGIG